MPDDEARAPVVPAGHSSLYPGMLEAATVDKPLSLYAAMMAAGPRSCVIDLHFVEMRCDYQQTGYEDIDSQGPYELVRSRIHYLNTCFDFLKELLRSGELASSGIEPNNPVAQRRPIDRSRWETADRVEWSGEDSPWPMVYPDDTSEVNFSGGKLEFIEIWSDGAGVVAAAPASTEQVVTSKLDRDRNPINKDGVWVWSKPIDLEAKPPTSRDKYPWWDFDREFWRASAEPAHENYQDLKNYMMKWSTKHLTHPYKKLKSGEPQSAPVNQLHVRLKKLEFHLKESKSQKSAFLD